MKESDGREAGKKEREREKGGRIERKERRGRKGGREEITTCGVSSPSDTHGILLQVSS